jgi:putative transposase
MTDTIDDVAAKAGRQEPVEPAIDKQSVAEQLVAQAREKGIELVGPNGLLSELTKRVFETALEAGMSDHLGYDKHHPTGRNHGNSRNGLRAKTVLTEIGPVEIEVPRDLDASFQPKIVKKRQRRLTGVDQIVLSWHHPGPPWHLSGSEDAPPVWPHLRRASPFIGDVPGAARLQARPSFRRRDW